MVDFFKSLLPYTTTLPIFGGAVAFLWTSVILLLNRKREREKAEFERFHDVMRKIQIDETAGGKEAPYIEVQVAAIYELGFLTRYYPLSYTYLKAKKYEWQDKETHKNDKYRTMGIPAIELALTKIERGTFIQRIVRDFKQFYNS